MATKGRSNLYGRSKGSKKVHPTKHINYPWAKSFNWNRMRSHFNEHSKNVDAKDRYEYEAKAKRFANSINYKYNESFVDKRGFTYKYSNKTNELVIVSKKGIIISYFKPREGKIYYLNERKKRRIK